MSNLVKLLLIVCIAYGGYQWYKKSEIKKVPQSWYTYQFKSENIQAQFPKQPKIREHSLQSMSVEFAGVRITNYEFSIGIVKGKNALRGDYYPDSLKNKGATVESSRDIYIGDYYTQEFDLLLNGKSVVQRFIHYKDSLVTQTAFYPESEHPTDDVKKFLNSISL